MIKIGDKITVRNSKELARKGLNVLVNKTGMVTKVLKSQGGVIGVYADVLNTNFSPILVTSETERDGGVVDHK